MGHFLTSVKFCKIPQQYQNSVEKANSAAWLEIPRPAEDCGPYPYVLCIWHLHEKKQ